MDGTILLTAGVLVALGALYVSARRAVTIVELQVERGVMRVVRGGIAPPILGDLRDVAKSPPIQDVRITILRSSGRAEVRFSGTIRDDQAQRIRNVVGSVPLARLINAPRRR